MKISYRTHPILEVLESGDFSKVKYYPREDIDFYNRFTDELKLWFPKYKEDFKSKIYYITLPFWEASCKAKKKLHTLYEEIRENDISTLPDVVGTFINGDSVIMIYRKYNKEWGKIETAMFHFSKEGLPVQCFLENSLIQDGRTGRGNYSPLIKEFNKMSWEEISHQIQLTYGDIIMLQLFILYAQIETKNCQLAKRLRT